MTERYNYKKTESYWQAKWEEKKVFRTIKTENKKKYYVLEMFPYPSGKIHMGHVRNYTLGDVVARYKKMCGFNVLHPMGWDAFGLPAENAAIVEKKAPSSWTYQNIDVMRNQLKTMGLSIDWSREIATCHPDYYKHEQAFFLDLLKTGLAYKKESLVNWDPVDKTVLANEQVIDGRGWRSGAITESKKLSQWFLKTSAYSEELLSYLDQLEDWPNKVKIMQNNWIGKSIGAEINFKIHNPQNLNNNYIKVFTTRPDTIFGASFCALSIDHDIAKQIINLDLEAKKFKNKSLKTNPDNDKIGFKTNLFVEHPFLENSLLPVFIANFVLMDYGSGAVFGCPAHDQRDLDFANKYNLKVLPVILPEGISKEKFIINKDAYMGNGALINSDFLNGKDVEEAKTEIINQINARDIGKKKVNYRLRDWGLSRQRYWGCPIPVMYREDGEIIPVPKKDLPVLLPHLEKFTGSGNVLQNHKEWKNTVCPNTGMSAVRETDTFDTFFESSWYFLRYCNPRNSEPFLKEDINYWLPVDQYIGGIEHAILHLLYARFFIKALRDLKYISIDEPFKGLFTQGMVTHRTFKNNNNEWISPDEVINEKEKYFDESKKEVVVGKVEKMSKSKKNVVDPTFIIQKYGADTARWFMLSDSPPDRDLEWTDNGVEGSYKFMNRIWDVTNIALEKKLPTNKREGDVFLNEKVEETIMNVTKNIEMFHFNKAVANLYEVVNSIQNNLRNNLVSQNSIFNALKKLSLLIHPFTPHLSEELWNKLGESGLAIEQNWPKSSLIKKKFISKLAIQINGKTKEILEIETGLEEKEVKNLVLNNSKIKKIIRGKNQKKTIFVPEKIFNIVLN